MTSRPRRAPWRRSSPCSAPRAASASRARPAACCPTCCPRPNRNRPDVTWLGFPVAIAVALLVVPAGVRGLLDAGLVRENFRGAQLAFPLGAILATAGLVALAPLAFLDDRGSLEL